MDIATYTFARLHKYHGYIEIDVSVERSSDISRRKRDLRRAHSRERDKDIGCVSHDITCDRRDR